MVMLAFVNTEVSKSRLIESLEAHAAADRIISGSYWRNGRGGCAVGCSIHDFRPGEESYHSLYEPLFGIPRLIAKLEDSIFERLSWDYQKQWPLRFANSIREGADLSGVWDRFAYWMLADPEDGVLKLTKPGTRQHDAIKAVADLYRRKIDGENVSKEEWEAVRSKAADCTVAAYAACAYAACTAAACAAYAYAAYAAKELATKRQADKLIELFSAC